MADDFTIAPFTYRAPQGELDNLQRRLTDARWPEQETGERWAQGVALDSLRSLVDYWRDGYDWRRCEADLARWPQFTTQIDGLEIHFIHVRSRHSGALPLILTHGWPSTFLLYRDLIGPLTDPTAHGGTVAEAFDVVIPSLPGFGFSARPAERGWNAERTARAWAVLMGRLGYQRYVAQGGDWGAYVTTALAQQSAPGLVAIHLNSALTIPNELPDELLPDQQRSLDAMGAFLAQRAAYGAIQGTRPQTLGYALADSPIGQAAWIYDIFDSGTGSRGRPEEALSRDAMLDEITLFWLTNTATSSGRFYLEQAQLMGERGNPGHVDLPVAISVFPDDMPPARSWADAVYPQLVYWHDVARGGHFAALEVPDLFTEELRSAFQSFRGV